MFPEKGTAAYDRKIAAAKKRFSLAYPEVEIPDSDDESADGVSPQATKTASDPRGLTIGKPKIMKSRTDPSCLEAPKTALVKANEALENDPANVRLHEASVEDSATDDTASSASGLDVDAVIEAGAGEYDDSDSNLTSTAGSDEGLGI